VARSANAKRKRKKKRVASQCWPTRTHADLQNHKVCQQQCTECVCGQRTTRQRLGWVEQRASAQVQTATRHRECRTRSCQTRQLLLGSKGKSKDNKSNEIVQLCISSHFRSRVCAPLGQSQRLWPDITERMRTAVSGIETHVCKHSPSLLIKLKSWQRVTCMCDEP
jgi:hypothetical protein